MRPARNAVWAQGEEHFGKGGVKLRLDQDGGVNESKTVRRAGACIHSQVTGRKRDSGNEVVQHGLPTHTDCPGAPDDVHDSPAAETAK